MGVKVNKQDIIDDIIRVSNEIRKIPLTTEYELHGKFSYSLVRKNFGKWESALLAANLELTDGHRKLNSDADIVNEINRLSELLGREPTYTDIKKHSVISPDTIMRRTGHTTKFNPREPLSSLDASWNVKDISDSDGYWISGFTTGEGCFVVRSTGGLTFSLGQRADDISNLEFVRDIMNIPKEIYVYSNSTRRSQGHRAGDECRLTINNRWIIKERVLPFFDRFQLKGRKKLDYEIFREVTLFMCERDDRGSFHKRLTDTEKSILLDLSNKLKSLRKDPTSML